MKMQIYEVIGEHKGEFDFFGCSHKKNKAEGMVKEYERLLPNWSFNIIEVFPRKAVEWRIDQ